MDELVYTVDDEGRLSHVNGAWDAFAIANDAPELVSSRVLGKPFLDFISGAEAQHFTQVLMQRAREAEAPLILGFDCDSSRERRRMEMTITRVAGGFEFRTRARSIVARADASLLDRHRPSAAEFLTLCSWCNRVRVDDRWMEIEEAAESLRFLERRVLPRLTHGVCEPCARQVLAEWVPTEPPVRM